MIIVCIVYLYAVYEFPVCFAEAHINVCACLYIAVDIDAAGLDPEESDPPPHQRSPKASPNTVISPITREKRMPFFKKVKHADRRSLALNLSVTAASRRACVACLHLNSHAGLLHSLFPFSPSVLSLFLSIPIFHSPLVFSFCLFPFFLSSAKQRQKSVSRASQRAVCQWTLIPVMQYLEFINYSLLLFTQRQEN